MWCDRCRTDAAAEISPDTGRAACATCGSDLGSVRRPTTDHARELLKKWSAGIELDAASEPIATRPDLTSPQPARDLRSVRTSVDEGRAPRPAAIDPPQGAAAIEHADVEPPVVSMPFVAPDEAPAAIRIDAAHAGGATPPHFDVEMAIATGSEKSSSGAQIIGQVLAYAGVLALTVGTALVIWSYFGGEADYAPTGWLVATGGQMLLFLGVVTLVAGSLEQTNRDVRVRIESLGERLARIEQKTIELARQNREADERASRMSDATRRRA